MGRKFSEDFNRRRRWSLKRFRKEEDAPLLYYYLLSCPFFAPSLILHSILLVSATPPQGMVVEREWRRTSVFAQVI